MNRRRFFESIPKNKKALKEIETAAFVIVLSPVNDWDYDQVSLEYRVRPTANTLSFCIQYTRSNDHMCKSMKFDCRRIRIRCLVS